MSIYSNKKNFAASLRSRVRVCRAVCAQKDLRGRRDVQNEMSSPGGGQHLESSGGEKVQDAIRGRALGRLVLDRMESCTAG